MESRRKKYKLPNIQKPYARRNCSRFGKSCCQIWILREQRFVPNFEGRRLWVVLKLLWTCLDPVLLRSLSSKLCMWPAVLRVFLSFFFVVNSIGHRSRFVSRRMCSDPHRGKQTPQHIFRKQRVAQVRASLQQNLSCGKGRVSFQVDWLRFCYEANPERVPSKRCARSLPTEFQRL